MKVTYVFYAWPSGLDAGQILSSRTVVSLAHNHVDTCTGAELTNTCKLELSVQVSVRDFGFTRLLHVLYWAESHHHLIVRVRQVKAGPLLFKSSVSRQ